MMMMSGFEERLDTLLIKQTASCRAEHDSRLLHRRTVIPAVSFQ